MRIAGIVTIHDVPNYGSVLQAYATQQVLLKCGYKSIFIDYNRYNKWRINNGGARKGNPIRSFLRMLGLKADHRKAIKLKVFKRKYLKLTKKFHDLDALRIYDWSDYDLFVVGSDQVWNTNYLQGDSYFLLSFVPENIKKISISSSFALKKLPECFEDKFKKYLSRFSSISVREQYGVAIIKEQLNIPTPVKLLLDPTLLLSHKEWLNLLGTKTPYQGGKYILFYMWAYAFEPRPYIYEVVKYFQNKLNCRVIALEGCYNTCPKDLKMENWSDSSIPDFLNLFANAELVITSSFHGSAFALNFGRPLISIIPNTGDDRQSSLLNSLGVDNCAVKLGTDIDKINPYYDILAQQSKLEDIRKENLRWISDHC